MGKLPTWTIAVSDDPSYIARTSSPWSKVCEQAKDTTPALILTHFKQKKVCIPYYAYKGCFQNDNRMTAVIPLEDWLELLTGENND